MKRRATFVFLANLAVYSSVYSSHYFIKELYKNSFQLSYSDSSLLDMLTIIRLVSAYFISSVADRTQYHGALAILCLAGYVATISMIGFFPGVFNVTGLGLKPVLLDSMIKVFDSGIFPIMETLVINASSFGENGKATYSYMRFSIVLGRFIAQLTNIITDEGCRYFKVVSPSNMVVISFVYFLFSVPLLVAIQAMPVRTEGAAEGECVRRETFFRSLRRVLSTGYVLVLIFVGCQGVHRVAVSNYQPVLLDGIFPKSNRTRCIFLLRCVPDFVIEMYAPYVEHRIGMFWMILLGGTAGIIKALVCAFYPKNVSQNVTFVYFIFFESFKALFSSFVSYGCTRLNKHYNAPEVQTSAQGLYNGMYTAVGAAVSGVIGWKTIKDEAGEDPSFETFFLTSAVVGMAGLFPVLYLAVRRSLAATG